MTEESDEARRRRDQMQRDMTKFINDGAELNDLLKNRTHLARALHLMFVDENGSDLYDAAVDLGFVTPRECVIAAIDTVAERLSRSPDFRAQISRLVIGELEKQVPGQGRGMGH